MVRQSPVNRQSSVQSRQKVSYSKGNQKQIYILGTILLPIKTINREPCKTTRERKIAEKSKNLYNVYETNIHCT